MIHIDLQPELEARIAAQAQARGLTLDQYIAQQLEASAALGATEQHAVEQAIENTRSFRREQAAQRDAAVDAMGKFAAQHSFSSGGADLQAMAHEGHKY